MAVLKDLIVHGRSRFINGIDADSIHANLIDANDGIFKTITTTTLDAETITTDMLTAQNARVAQTLTVDGTISTNKWEAANIANIGGNFYISPTGKADSGNITVTKTGSTTINGVSVGVYTLVVGSASFGVTSTSSTIWGTSSKVIFTGSIAYNSSKKYPLGTCNGTMTSVSTGSGTLTGFTITGVNSPALDVFFKEQGITSVSSTACTGYEMQISVYQSYYSSALHPIGILLTSYGKDKKQYIDIYGGANTLGDSASGFANPSVRIGQLDGLPNIVDGSTDSTTAPSGWGIYTDNGFFRGKIVSNAGKIGNFTINSALYSNNHSSWNTNNSGIYINNDGIAGGPGGKWWFWQDGSAQIGAMTLSAAGVLTVPAANVSGALTAATISADKLTAGTINSSILTANNIVTDTITMGTAGSNAYIYVSKNNKSTAINSETKNWRIILGNVFGVSEAGYLTASSGKIGGWTIGTDRLSINTIGSTNGIMISPSNTTSYTINGASRSNLRLAIGTKFGVDNDGNLYANGANITSINGANITANTIGADQIASNAITADKIEAGAVTVGKVNPKVYAYSNGGRGTGYAKIFTISHTEAYHNAPISFLFHNRGKKETYVTFNFANNGTPTSAVVQNATYDGDTPFYYVSKGSGVYDVYFQLAESYDDTYITNYINQYSTGLTITWDGAYYGTSLPSGAVSFTKLVGSRTSAELDNAAKTATTYITKIDDAGIRIHPSSTENNSIVINSEGMEIFKGGTTSDYSVAKYGDIARVGKSNNKHITIDSTGLNIWTGPDDSGSADDYQIAKIGLDENGDLDTRLGLLDEYHTIITSDSFVINDGTGAIFTVDPSGATTTGEATLMRRPQRKPSSGTSYVLTGTMAKSVTYTIRLYNSTKEDEPNNYESTSWAIPSNQTAPMERSISKNSNTLHLVFTPQGSMSLARGRLTATLTRTSTSIDFHEWEIVYTGHIEIPKFDFKGKVYASEAIVSYGRCLSNTGSGYGVWIGRGISNNEWTTNRGVFDVKTGTWLIRRDNDNKTQIPRIYSTSVSGRNVYVNADGIVGYNSSSKRWKEDIRKLIDHQDQKIQILKGIKSIKPVLFKYREDIVDGADPNVDMLGLIAEDVYENLPIAAYLNDEDPNLVDGWSEPTIITAILLLAQEVAKENEELKIRIERLEAK